MASTTSNLAMRIGDGDTAAVDRTRRQVPFRTARALRTLGHAIEYLADEFLRDPAPPSTQSPRLEAVRLLMLLNREVYCACPQASPLGLRSRLRWMLGRS